jgi:co-chaperonin GroES (HSP10)
MKKVEAIGDKIVVRVVFKQNVRESGIVIPETVKTEPQNQGVVESTGADVKYIKVGDTIFYHPRGGQDFIVDDIIYKVLGESEIYGVLKEA